MIPWTVGIRASDVATAFASFSLPKARRALPNRQNRALNAEFTCGMLQIMCLLICRRWASVSPGTDAFALLILCQSRTFCALQLSVDCTSIRKIFKAGRIRLKGASSWVKRSATPFASSANCGSCDCR